MEKQTKFHVKKGDLVRVIAGSSKGKEGRILEVNRKKSRVAVEGAGMITVHTKPNAANPQGGRIEKEGFIHISNVMPLDKNGKPSRVNYKVNAEGKKVRVANTTGEEL